MKPEAVEQALLNLMKLNEKLLRRVDRLETIVAALIQSQEALLAANGLQDPDLAERLEGLHRRLEGEG